MLAVELARLAGAQGHHLEAADDEPRLLNGVQNLPHVLYGVGLNERQGSGVHTNLQISKVQPS